MTLHKNDALYTNDRPPSAPETTPPLTLRVDAAAAADVFFLSAPPRFLPPVFCTKGPRANKS
uniref:Uncharacterized protein n=1 Tax=Romanomermis culicivorax TaxID=13658 RepID=A0A915K3J4_ROMCU